MDTASEPTTIRPPAPADAQALARLMGELGYPSTAEQVQGRIDRADANPDYRTHVAEVNGQVVGMMGLQRGWAYEKDAPFVRVLALVVSAGARRRGVGARLLGTAHAWARELGAYGVHLTTSLHRDEAHRFYERVGFERTGWRYARTPA